MGDETVVVLSTSADVNQFTNTGIFYELYDVLFCFDKLSSSSIIVRFPWYCFRTGPLATRPCEILLVLSSNRHTHVFLKIFILFHSFIPLGVISVIVSWFGVVLGASSVSCGWNA